MRLARLALCWALRTEKTLNTATGDSLVSFWKWLSEGPEDAERYQRQLPDFMRLIGAENGVANELSTPLGLNRVLQAIHNFP